MRHLRSAILTGMILVLSGFGGFEVMWGDHYGTDVRSVVTYAGANRDLKVEVVGNPFAADQAATNTAVTNALQGAVRGVHANFTTRPGADARTRYRVVVLFNPARNFLEDHACGDPAGLRPGKGGSRQSILMVFCSDDFAESWMVAHMRAFTGTTDPRFQTVIANLAWRLIPDEQFDFQ